MAGILAIVGIVSIFMDPSPSSSQDLLSSFQANTYAYAFSDLFWVVFAVGATPFVVYLAAALRPQGAALTRAAMLLVVFGAFALAAQSATFYGALWSISTTAAPSAATQTYEAALWSNLTTGWQMLAFVSLGAGLLLFGGAAWNGRILPKWLAAVAVVGGAAALLGTVALGLTPQDPSVAFVLIAVSPFAFLVWAFAAPLLYRRAASVSSGPPPPARVA